MKKIILLVFIIILFSCKHNEQIASTKYRIKYIKTQNSPENGNVKLFEIYKTKKNDSIWNQNIIYRNGKIDLSESSFYTLQISKGETKHIYTGKLIVHSYIKHIKNIEFQFCDNKDGRQIISKIISTSNIINFKFSNPDSEQLSGIIKITGRWEEKDGKWTIIHNENEFLLVDNFKYTNNVFLEKYNLLKEKRIIHL